VNSKHLVDPELIPLLDQLSTDGITAENYRQVRAFSNELFEQRTALLPPSPDIDTTEREVPGPAGEPPVRVLVSYNSGVGEKLVER
jgi:hypothetical protein